MLACKSLIAAACLIVVVGAADHTISWGFDTSQANLEVKAGDSVTWAFDQAGNPQHTVTSNDSPALFDSGFLDVGQSFTHNFPVPGSFPYYCEPHSWMSGIITVLAAPTDSPPCAKGPRTRRKCKVACAANGLNYSKFKKVDGCPVCKCKCRDSLLKKACLTCGGGCQWARRQRLFGVFCLGVCLPCPPS